VVFPQLAKDAPPSTEYKYDVAFGNPPVEPTKETDRPLIKLDIFDMTGAVPAT
jgi:hypothetical protein